MANLEVDLFIPCFVDQLFPDTAENTVKVLEKAGCTVHYNPAQTCCGQPACNAGFWSEAWEVSHKFVNDFSGSRPVVSPSGSCVGFVRNTQSRLFRDTSIQADHRKLGGRIFELSEFLVDVLGVEDLGASLKAKATYHDACGALRECGIKEAPRKLLSNVQGLELTEMTDSETCCGFGGTFSVKFEPISTGMADQKLARAEEVEAEYMISTDISCLMHLEGYARRNKEGVGSSVKVLHLADVLASGW